MKNMYDVIIPVAGKEVNFVHRVATSLRKHLQEADTIYIITNYRNIQKIKKTYRIENIQVIDEDKLLSGLSLEAIRNIARKYTKCTSPGWYYQQFLKLGFALSPFAKNYYLSWDADTLLVSDLTFFVDGKPIFTRKSEYNDNYFYTIEKLLGLKKNVPYSFIAEHMLFYTEFVKELLSAISSSSTIGTTWFEKIMRACNYDHPLPGFSEFETYGTYVQHFYPNAYKTRQLRTFRRGGLLRGRYITEKLLDKLSIDFDTISFEMRDVPPFPYNIPNIWWRFKDLLYKGLNNNLSIVIRKIFDNK